MYLLTVQFVILLDILMYGVLGFLLPDRINYTTKNKDSFMSQFFIFEWADVLQPDPT